MSRIALAFRCFFRLLLGGELPANAAQYLPESAQPALPEVKAKEQPELSAEAESKSDSPKDNKPEKKAPESKPSATPAKPSAKTGDHHRDGALALLALFQREGRLIDFLREPIDDYDDDDIGAAVRDIHRGCRKVIEEHLAIEPVMPGEEDQDITVPKGFDPGEIRLIGEVKGQPPFKGTMRHHGWRVTKASLPTLSDGVDRHVLAPAEVEVS